MGKRKVVHPEWIWQGNVGYVIPAKSEISMSSHKVTGDWSEIGAYPPRHIRDERYCGNFSLTWIEACGSDF